MSTGRTAALRAGSIACHETKRTVSQIADRPCGHEAALTTTTKEAYIYG